MNCSSFRQPRHRVHRPRGVALLTVLLILALLTTLAAYMTEDELLALRRLSNLYEAEQSYQMATGSEKWALVLLARDLETSETDHLNEDWGKLGVPVTVEQGTLATVIEDAQGRFNLNNLSARDEVWYPAFRRLLRLLELDENLADAVVDWIDTDQDATGGNGAEDLTYLNEDPSYRAANQMFTETGELLWVAGFDIDTVARLAPYVTAIPQAGTPINVNTCTAVVMRILTEDILSEGAVEALIAGRGEDGFESSQAFLETPELEGQGGKIGQLIATASSYFLVNNRAQFGRITLNIQSLIQREREGAQVRVLQRRRFTS